jgi:hypothetical protein
MHASDLVGIDGSTRVLIVHIPLIKYNYLKNPFEAVAEFKS